MVARCSPALSLLLDRAHGQVATAVKQRPDSRYDRDMLGPVVEQRCWLCERPTPPEALFSLDLPGVEGAHQVCRPCSDDLAQQGRRLEPFEPRLRSTLGYRWTTSLAPDACVLRREVLGQDVAALASGASRAAAARELEQVRARLFAPGAARPDERALVDALCLAVIAEEELAPWRQVERAASAASDEVGALAGLYAHQVARVRLARLTDEVLPLVNAGGTTSELDPRRLAGDLWLRVEGAARFVFARDPQLWELLEAARVAYTMVLPGSARGIASALEARVAVLRAVLLVERGDLRPGTGEGRGPTREPDALERAQDWLRGCYERAGAPGAPAALRDARLPLLRGLIEGVRGNASGLQTSLDEALAWLEATPASAPGGDPGREGIELVVQRDRYVRYAHAQHMGEQATRALRRCCALRPDDRGLLLELARVYVQRALPGVAREVLEGRLGRRDVDEALVEREVHEALAEARAELERLRRGDPGDRDARLLHATCLVRLGSHREALAALDGEALLDEVRAEPEPPHDPHRAEVLHLAGRCAWALEREQDALDLLAAAFACSDPDDGRRRVRRTLLHVLLQGLREQVLEADAAPDPEPWRPEPTEPGGPGDPAAENAAGPTRRVLRAFFETLGRHRRALRDELAGGAVDILCAFLLLELATPTERAELRHLGAPMLADMADVGFGPSRLDRASGGSPTASLFLACRALHARRLPEAVLQDRRARDAGGPALPIDLLLRALAVVQRGGDLARREALAAVVALISALAP